MRKYRLFFLTIVTCMLISSLLLVNATTLNKDWSTTRNEPISGYLTNDSVERMKKAGVSDEDLLSLLQQIKAYTPTKTQIDNYVDDLVSNTVGVNTQPNKPVDYEVTKNGDSITPSGTIPYSDLSKKWDPLASRSVSTLSNVINANDNTGVYYCVRSISGHNQMTSFAELPSLSSVHANDRPYQMFTFATSNSFTAYGDIGLVYLPSSGTWYGFYNVVENGTRYQTYDISFTGSSELYFHIQFYNAPDKVILTIRDASSWSAVATISYTFALDCVNSSYSTTQIAKEITLAQHNNGTLNISSGTIMNNAQFTQTYIYTPNTYYQFTSAYCAAAFRQGPTAAAYGKVTASYSAWTTDTVTISFN